MYERHISVSLALVILLAAGCATLNFGKDPVTRVKVVLAEGNHVANATYYDVVRMLKMAADNYQADPSAEHGKKLAMAYALESKVNALFEEYRTASTALEAFVTAYDGNEDKLSFLVNTLSEKLKALTMAAATK